MKYTNNPTPIIPTNAAEAAATGAVGKGFGLEHLTMTVIKKILKITSTREFEEILQRASEKNIKISVEKVFNEHAGARGPFGPRGAYFPVYYTEDWNKLKQLKEEIKKEKASRKYNPSIDPFAGIV